MVPAQAHTLSLTCKPKGKVARLAEIAASVGEASGPTVLLKTSEGGENDPFAGSTSGITGSATFQCRRLVPDAKECSTHIRKPSSIAIENRPTF